MFLGKELMYGKTGILRTRQMNAIAQQQLAELGLHVKALCWQESYRLDNSKLSKLRKH